MKNGLHDFTDGEILQRYFKDVRAIPLLSEAEEHELARRVQEGDEEAKQKMIEANLRLVIYLVKRYSNRGLPVPDLVEEGNLGLIKAVERYDPERNCRFSTYAVWWIRQYMRRAIVNQSKVVRLPIHVMEELNLYVKGCRDFIKKYNREPTLKEISVYLDHDFTTITSFLGSFSQLVQLTSGSRTEEYQGASIPMEQLADDNAVNPMEHLHRIIRLKTILLWLNELTAKEKYIIIHRFGLYNNDPQTLEEIGQTLELTRERIRQIEAKALLKLRRIIEKHKITLEDLV
jgi:RNA polymerase nonessential primary-like sigma factor